MTEEERFFDKVKYSDGCWEWQGHKTPKGYGYFWSNKTIVRAHRWSYHYFRGEVGDLHVCHHCDNPICVNPDHMFLGTNAMNTRDRDNKGRQWNAAKTHCKHGHPFDEKNTGIIKSTGYRYCKECKRKRDVGRWAKRKKAFKEVESDS